MSRIPRFLTSIFGPPFNGLWLIVLLYFALRFVFPPTSQILRGNLPDSDDYMYLTQMLDWLQGQGWYDNVQYRLNPPEGSVIPFSRLAMLPMAGITILLEGLGQEPRAAALGMAFIYPLLLLAGFFHILRRVAANFVPESWAGATAYIALFTTAFALMFTPGHVDHHGLILMITTAAFGCALRMMEQPESTRWAIAAGAMLAFGMTIALEMLPWVVVIATWLGLWAAVNGGSAARQGLVFGLSLFLASAIGLLTSRAPEAFMVIDLLTYSTVYVFMAGGIALGFGAIAVAGNSPSRRILAGVVVAGCAAALFFHSFPDLMTGPFGALSPALVKLILNEAGESTPLREEIPSAFALFSYLSPTLLALGTAGFFFGQADGQKRWRWGLLIALLTAALLLTTFYQQRFVGVMGTLTVFPLTVLLQRGWTWSSARWQGGRKIPAIIGLLLLVGPLPAVFLPALAGANAFDNGILLFPPVSDARDPCDTKILEQILNDPASLGRSPKLIVNNMDLGPELLFRTPHNILAAPFLDVGGEVDADRFFSTPSPEEAEEIARRHRADLVVSCSIFPQSYLRSSPDADANTPHEFTPNFILLLAHQIPPAWLREVRDPRLDNFVVYEVLPAETSVCPAPAR